MGIHVHAHGHPSPYPREPVRVHGMPMRKCPWADPITLNARGLALCRGARGFTHSVVCPSQNSLVRLQRRPSKHRRDPNAIWRVFHELSFSLLPPFLHLSSSLPLCPFYAYRLCPMLRNMCFSSFGTLCSRCCSAAPEFGSVRQCALRSCFVTTSFYPSSHDVEVSGCIHSLPDPRSRIATTYPHEIPMAKCHMHKDFPSTY